MIADGSELASTIVTNLLTYGLYGCSALVVIFMALFSRKLNQVDADRRAKDRARREWEETPEGQAAMLAEALEMEAAAEAREREEQRTRLELDWPQYVIEVL